MIDDKKAERISKRIKEAVQAQKILCSMLEHYIRENERNGYLEICTLICKELEGIERIILRNKPRKDLKVNHK